jgi:predicted AAA+ superfamily ATPase
VDLRSILRLCEDQRRIPDLTLAKDLEKILARLEQLLPPPPPATDWQASVAFRWRSSGRRGGAGASAGWLQPVRHVHRIKLSDLRGIDKQIERVEQNTRQFLDGKPANNVLLTGARGTGKSSIVKGLLNKYTKQGLRLIEVEKNDLVDLPHIVDQVAPRKERFLLFCDDLSFHGAEDGYIALKVALDGSISTTSENLLIYATSNRRHLMPEYMAENLETKYVDDEIHPGETVEEKISLSERFGLWVTFYPFDQDEYVEIVGHWLKSFDSSPSEKAKEEALQWALQRGSRSGRVAYQFARDWAGRHSKKR